MMVIGDLDVPIASTNVPIAKAPAVQKAPPAPKVEVVKKQRQPEEVVYRSMPDDDIPLAVIPHHDDDIPLMSLPKN